MAEHLLTKKKKRWVKQFKPTAAMRGTPLHYNAVDAKRYEMRLRRLIKQMVRETEKEMRRLMESEAAESHFARDENIGSQARIVSNQLMARFQQLFNKRSKGLADMVIRDAKASSKSTLHTSLKELSGGLSLKTDIMHNQLANVIMASTAENVGLIKSIPQQYLGKVQGSLMRSIASGKGMHDFMPTLRKLGAVTDRRARMIAHDQTRKVYNSINMARMEAVGIKEAEWIHSGGSHEPRPTHMEMDGKTFLLSEGLYDSAVGRKIQPGQEPNCRCTYRPIIKFNQGEAE